MASLGQVKGVTTNLAAQILRDYDLEALAALEPSVLTKYSRVGLATAQRIIEWAVHEKVNEEARAALEQQLDEMEEGLVPWPTDEPLPTPGPLPQGPTAESDPPASPRIQRIREASKE